MARCIWARFIAKLTRLFIKRYGPLQVLGHTFTILGQLSQMKISRGFTLGRRLLKPIDGLGQVFFNSITGPQT